MHNPSGLNESEGNIMKKAISYYNEYHYTVEIDGEEVYEAGNNPYDSQGYIHDLENSEVIPLETMKQYCEKTTREIAEEQGVEYIGIEYDESYADEIKSLS